jgi:hypothetical protein
MLGRNRNAEPALYLSGLTDRRIEMTKVELRMSGSDVDPDDLDCFEKIELIEQADSVWLVLEIQLPPVEECIERHEFVSEEPDVPLQLGKSLEEYIQVITEVQEFVAPISNSVYLVDAEENVIRVEQPFESYEAAKAQADEWEENQLPVQYQVTLSALHSDLPQESLEQIKQKRRTLGDKNHE